MKKCWQVKQVTEEFLLDVLCDTRRFERYMNIFDLDKDGLISLIGREIQYLQSQK
jgi:hypothetical protein